MGTRTPGVQAAIGRLPDGARVLDAACGVGIDALSLHRRRFRVTATDASPAMVDQCRARLAAAGADGAVSTCAWAALPERFGPVFDALLCTGNSLAHTRSAADRRAALSGFAGVLVEGGVLIVDSQDWSALHERGSHRDDDPLVVARDGRRTTRHFDWRVPARFGEPIELDLILVGDDGDRERTTTDTVTFCPFTTEELLADLEGAAFVDVVVQQNPGDDRYSVVARRS